MGEKPADEYRKLTRINEVLMDRIERLEASKGSAWSMFQAAMALEKEVHARTSDLEHALADLSHRNRDLALARAAAEEANRSKTRFLRAASHDLLQPIAAARLFLGVLESTADEGTQAEVIGQLKGAFQSIEELMQGVLEISRLDSQRIEFSRKPVPLADLFARLAHEYTPQAAKKGLRLLFAPTSAVVDSDPTYLRRVIQNLVSNALKYTRRGGVVVGARKRGCQVWLEVHDSGIGIIAADRARIFDEFQRAHDSAHNDLGEPGMGLGLAIVRRACAKLGHPILLDSEPGRGTVFRVGLPLAFPLAPEGESDAAVPAPAAAGSLQGATVILIENDRVLQRAYALLLRDVADMKVYTLSSTAGADALLDARPDLRPDVILADYHLDGDDTGLVAIATLRGRLGPVPALMVTAHGGPEIARGCAALQVPLLMKPVTPEALREALSEAISVQR